MTVTTTVSPAQLAAGRQVHGEQGQQLVAVGHRPGVVDGHQPVGVAVEGEARGRPRRPPPRRPGTSGWVEPQPSLMFTPSGSAGRSTSPPPRARRRPPGRRSLAAPLAQSSTTDSPSSRRPLEGRRQVVGVVVAAPGSAPSRRPAAHGRAAGRRRGRPASGLELGLDRPPPTSAVSLVPPGAEELDAVVGEGVVGGRDHRRRAGPGARRTRPRRGWGGRRGRRRRRPRWPGRPRGRPGGAGPSAGCPGRPGRPAAGSTRAAARPRASASSAVSSALATPRTPSVPKRRLGHPATAWSTAGALRAFFRPYFLLSFSRASRVRRPARLRRRAQLGVELDEGPGDAQAQRPGLARHPAAVDGGVDVVGLGRGRSPAAAR